MGGGSTEWRSYSRQSRSPCRGAWTVTEIQIRISDRRNSSRRWIGSPVSRRRSSESDSESDTILTLQQTVQHVIESLSYLAFEEDFSTLTNRIIMICYLACMM